MSVAVRWLAAATLVAACQHNINTPFPSGLEPLEADMASCPTDMTTEMISITSTDSDYIRVYGCGYVQLAPAVVWPATHSPDPNVAICSTTSHTVDIDNQPQYEYSFLVHYEVDNVLTVTWDDQWRMGLIEGTEDAPTLGMIKHQKTDGSSFITLSEGTIQVLATDDPDVTELDFVEHLNAVEASTTDVIEGVTHNYNSLVAVSHGNPVPACP
ncbi:MAG TPA: hypothetical protein VMJ10_25850 [Kofleriaceae bacterium]|nr:hypothetical protein [Kofleriaceae bacterium]